MSRKGRLPQNLLVFLFFSGALFTVSRPSEAYDTVGLNATPSAFHQTNLVEMRWKADVAEFVNPDPSTYDLKIEFNSANFNGRLGNVGLGVMVQNVLHKYQEASCSVDSLPGGLELYFSVIDDLARNPPAVAGVALDPAASDSPPSFKRLFQDIDGLGIVGNNIYATAAIGDDRISGPVTIEWHLKRGNLVTNPPGNLKRNIVCNWVPLLGEFREWIVEVDINGAHYGVATYYLPEVYASYLDPFAPLILHQEHFAACGNKLHMNATDVVYYDFAVRKAGSSNWIPIPDWQVNYSYDGECAPAPSDLRHGLGTSVRSGKKVLSSRSGHDNDVGLKRCDKASGANLFTCSQPVLFSGIDLPPAGELAIRNVSVSSSSNGATLRWETSRPASGMIRYGVTSDLGSSSAASLALATTHSSAISGLPGGLYLYRIESIAENGHLATQEGVFGTVGPCVSDPNTACLVDGRFEVKVEWHQAASSGPAQIMKFGGQRAETEESAFFWFFSESNFELGLKILDACAINQRFWVFISGLTNQGWTVYIRDTVTGATKTYSNPVGHLTTTTADTTSGLSCS
ncbi:MAG TPA: hypothetical protein VLQ45_00350 [Thermoanaerobaculia bacterium]|nr:hypothetical protein [Thermoanaerobaculia bacterium]